MRGLLVAAMLLATALPVLAEPIEPCPAGYESGIRVFGRGVCLTVEVDDPEASIPNPFLPATRPCNVPGMNGINVTYWGGGYAYVCANAGFVPPTNECPDLRRCVVVDLEDCGPHTVDPVIGIHGGSLYFCVGYRVEPEMDVPPIVVDLTPCPGGFDPRIAVGNTSVTICLVLFP